MKTLILSWLLMSAAISAENHEQACLDGDSSSCELAWYKLSNSLKPTAASFRFAKRGCEIDNALGANCEHMLEYLLAKNRLVEFKDTYKKICNNDKEMSCNIFVSSKLERKRFVEASVLGCDEGHKVSCVMISRYRQD